MNGLFTFHIGIKLVLLHSGWLCVHAFLETQNCSRHALANWHQLLIRILSPKSASDPSVAQCLAAMLKAAITHRQHRLVSHMLGKHSSIISEVRTDYAFLHSAIFVNNNEVLKALLAYTPNSLNLLTDALSRCGTLLPRSSSGSETIRLLARHFTPLSAESRTWLIMHTCSVGDVTLLEDFLGTGPLFDHRIFDAGGRIPTYVHFAISCGNVDSLRFLLDQGVFEGEDGQRVWMAIELALSFNQIDCYREIYQRFDEPQSARFFGFLGLAMNAEGIMADFIRKDRSLIFETFGDQKDPPPTLAQRALWNSIQRLRPGNTQLLLDEGVHIFPWRHIRDCSQSGDPFEIPWPYFNQNRDAFVRTQAVLDAFGLPKLRILV